MYYVNYQSDVYTHTHTKHKTHTDGIVKETLLIYLP